MSQAQNIALKSIMFSLKPITFVSGKGGVGKSVIAASLALSESQKGKKVLLVELGEKSFYEKFFHLKSDSIQYSPTEIFPNLSISLWSYRSCLKEYVSFYIKSQKIYNLFFENAVMQKFIQAAPALKELAILGKATSGPRNVGPKVPFDTIIIDSYSTGHHKALLMAPLAMSQTVHQGPMGYHSEKIFEVIRDPKLCGHVVVLKPEDLPTTEGLELYEFLKQKWQIESEMILNQYIDFPLTTLELGNIAKNGSSQEIKNVSDYFAQTSREQDICFEQIKKTKQNILQTPFCFQRDNPQKFIEALSREIKRI